MALGATTELGATMTILSGLLLLNTEVPYMQVKVKGHIFSADVRGGTLML